jgi:hypothetical protein
VISVRVTDRQDQLVADFLTVAAETLSNKPARLAVDNPSTFHTRDRHG